MSDLIKKEKSSIFFGTLSFIVWGHYVLSAVFLIILGIWSYVDRDIRGGIFSSRVCLFAIFSISGVSLIGSLVSLNLPGMGISLGVFLALSVGCAAKEIANEKAFDVFTTLCCFFSMGALVTSLIQKSLPGHTELYRPTAGAMNANYLGALVVMTLCMAIIRLMHGKSVDSSRPWYTPTKIFYIVTIILNTVLLFLTESRSSLLAFMAALAVYLVLSGYYIIFGVLAVGAISVWTVGWFYPDVFSWTNSLSYIITERADIWENAFSSFLSPSYAANFGKVFAILFGRGPMSYYHVYEAEGLFQANHAHNLLFDSLINVGVVGTLLYVIFAVMFIKFLISLRKGNRVEFLYLSMLFAAVAVQGIVDVTLMWHQTAVMLTTVGGYAASRKFHTKNAEA